MGQIKKLYQNSGNVETTVSTETNAVYPVTASSATYHSSSWGALGSNQTVGSILGALDQGYQYIGVASPSTSPISATHKIFYLASEEGTYSGFGGISVSGLTVLKNSGSGWSKEELHITSGGGGGGGGGTVTGYIGTTQVQSSAGAQNLTGISNLYIGSGGKIYFGSGTDTYIEYDANGFHFSKALYSDGQVSSGGIGSGGGGGGSVVSISNLLSTGTRIATLRIDGIDYDILTPSGGGGGSTVTVTPSLFSGNPIATISVDGTPTQLFYDVSVSNLLSSGTRVATLRVAGVDYDILAPSGGGGGGSYSAGTGIDITSNTISLKKATANSLGGVIPGNGLSINASGVLSVTGGGGGGGTLTDVTLGGVSVVSGTVAVLPAYPTTLPASDVSAWAKASTKPSYSLSEITGTDDLRAIEAITGTGLLKRTGNNTWSLDTNTYLTTHQTIYTLTLQAGTFGAGIYIPNSAAKTFKIPTTLDHIGDGTNRKYSDFVHITGTETITGAKTFSTNPVTIDSDSGIIVHQNSYIDIGAARLEYDSGSNCLRVTKRSGNATIGFYADGQVSSGGIAASASRNIVFTDGTQTISGQKTFSNALFSGITEPSYPSGHTVSIQDIVTRLVAVEAAL